VQALKQILGFCESSNEEFLELVWSLVFCVLFVGAGWCFC
jgi:hypothetical protein